MAGDPLANLFDDEPAATATQPDPLDNLFNDAEADPLANLFSEDAPETPQKPVERIPADNPNQKPFGMLDSLKAGLAGVGMGIAGEGIPIVKDFITSPVERSGREVGTVQAIARGGADVGGAILSAKFGGAPGASAYAGLTTLGRNAEQRRIAIEREHDQQAMRDGTLAAIPQAVDGALGESWAQTDGGDLAEAGLNSLITAGAFKFGAGADKGMTAAIAQGTRPLVAAGMNVLKQAGFDAVTSLPSAVVARANAENMTAQDWMNPGKLARVFEPESLLKEAALQAGISAGVQVPGTVGAAREGARLRNFEVDPEVQAELQGSLEGRVEALRMVQDNRANQRMVRDNAVERQRIEDELNNAAQTRDMVEHERGEVERAQSEQAVRDADRAFQDNPTAENAEARVAAMDTLVAIQKPAQQPHAPVGGGQGVAPAKSQLPTWLQTEINNNVVIADKLGIADTIEELSAQRLTATQVVLELQNRGIALPGDKVARDAIVRSVRASRNIPPMDDKVEFEAWLKSRVSGVPTKSAIGLSPLSALLTPVAATQSAAHSRLMLPAPEGRTAGEYPGVMRDSNPDSYIDPEWSPTSDASETLGYVPRMEDIEANNSAPDATAPALPGEPVSKGGGLDELFEGEGQGQASSGLKPSGAAAAGLGLSPLRRNRLDRGQGASEPIKRGLGFNRRLGQMNSRAFEPETQQAVNNLSHTDEASLQTARRGRIGIQQSMDAGEQVALKHGEKLINSWKPGQALNAEQTVAVRKYTDGVRKRLDEVQAELDADPTDSNRQVALNLQLEMFKSARAMLATRSEAGRALRIMRETISGPAIGGVTGKGASADAKVTPDDKILAVEHLQKLYGDKPVPESILTQIAEAGPDDAIKLVDIMAHQTKINNKTNIGDAIVNTFKAGLLTSLRTHERNVGGLTFKTAGERTIASSISGVVDKALSFRTGNRTTLGLSPLRSLANAGGAAAKSKEDMKAIMQGRYTDEMARKALQRFEFSHDQYTGDSKLNKVWDGYVNTVFRSTAAVDMPFRRFMFMESVSDQARLVAMDEAKAGAIPKSEVKARAQELTENPTADMRAEAAIYSEAMVYADKNKVATWADSGFNRMVLDPISKKYPKTGASLKLAKATVMPFMRTPLNIAWDILDKVLVSPAQAASKSPRVISGLIKGNLSKADQKVFADAVGNSGLGWGMILLGMKLYSEGLMSGSSEGETAAMRKTNEVAGKQPGALKVGDTWYRVQDVGTPLSNLMVFGASLAREANKPLDDESRRTKNIGMATANVMLDNPFLQGVQDVLDIGTNGPEGFVADRVAATIPAFVSDTGVLFDDTARDANKRDGDTTTDRFGKRIARRLPGLRNTLPPRVNAFGQTMPESKWGIINAMFPKEAVDNKNAGVRELIRLDVGLQEFKQKKGESQEQFMARAQMLGPIVDKAVNAAVGNANYQKLDDKTKREVLKTTIRRLEVNG